jgi:transcription elongation factor GreA
MITKIGKAKLEAQLLELKEKLEHTLIERRKAAEEGDLKENSAYIFQTTQAEVLKNQIDEISHTLATSKVSNGPEQMTVIEAGHWVSIKFDDGKKIEVVIVGKLDSGIKPGWVSYESPLAIAILGKTVGDKFEVNGRAGVVEEIRIVDLN